MCNVSGKILAYKWRGRGVLQWDFGREEFIVHAPADSQSTFNSSTNIGRPARGVSSSRPTHLICSPTTGCVRGLSLICHSKLNRMGKENDDEKCDIWRHLPPRTTDWLTAMPAGVVNINHQQYSLLIPSLYVGLTIWMVVVQSLFNSEF